MRWRSLTLRQVIALAVIVGQLIPVLLTSWQALERQRETLTLSLQQEHERLANVLTIGMERALWNLDEEEAGSLLGAVAADERVVRVAVSDNPMKLRRGPLEIVHPERHRARLLKVSKPLVKEDNKLGTVWLEMDTGQLEDRLASDFRRFLVIVGMQLMLSLVLTLAVLNRRFVAPVKRLLEHSAQLARRQLDKPLHWERDDELGRLAAGLEATRLSLQIAFDDIRASEQRFRSLSQLSSDWYWERDAEGRLTLISHGFTDVTGIPAERLIGMRAPDLPGFRYTPESWKEFELRTAAREPFRDLEWQVTRPDGEIRHGLSSGEPVFDADGGFRGYRGVGKDITASKIAEDATNSAARLRRLAEHLPGAAVYIEDGVARMNAAAEALTGYPRDALTDAALWFERIFATEGEAFRARMNDDPEAGQRAPCEVVIVCRDGSRRTVEFSAYRDAFCEIWLLHDITQREEAKAALQETLLEQRALLDNSAIGIAFIRERIIVRANAGIENLLGYAPGELTGKSTRCWYESEAAFQEIGTTLYATTLKGGVYSRDIQFVRKDGGRIWCHMTSKAILEGSRANVSVVQDISERKAAEHALLDAKQRLERGLAEVEQTRRDITLLSELSGFLQACPTAAEAHVAIGRYGPRLFPGGGGTLFHLDEGTEQLDEQLRWGELRSLPRFGADQCWALRRGQPFFMDAPEESLCCGHVAADDARPYACLPLTAQGKTFGLLYLEFHAQPGANGVDARHRLAVALAEQAGLALANLRLRETLRQQSIRDPLTGLFNRRHMHEVLQREIARAERGGRPLAVVVVDVDHFKHFNDTWGHDAGDQVLQAVARVLEQRVRATDVVCRFGGEEFVVILPEADEQQVLGRVADLLDGVRALRLRQGNRALDPVTASFGVAVHPVHGRDAQSLVDAADAALYRAKSGGRDRVEMAA